NYLALLGWSPGDDRENVTLSELAELFDVSRVNASPARFDMKKLEAINGEKIRALSIDELLERSLPFLKSSKVITGTQDEIEVIRKALPLIQERIITLSEVVGMVSFLFGEEVVVAEDEAKKISDEVSRATLKAAKEVLELVSEWSEISIESALRGELIEKMGLKPRVAFTPVRIAVTGSHISPPLFESLALLGKTRTLRRISALL
ncbi:MAG: hypothetical protein RLZZ131_547, partial [Actinomycetota bacterium]